MDVPDLFFNVDRVALYSPINGKTVTVPKDWEL
jgi:hypothetical protein